MSAPAWVSIAVAGLVLGAGCRLSDRDYTTIDAWLLCDECPDSLRRAVDAIGDKAVHTLDRALIGPSPGRRANKETQLRATYATLPAPPVSESTYVAGLLDNYVSKYQAHAALSLGDIGGGRALSALRRARDSAATRGYRADVVRIVEAVYALASEPPFAGTIQPSAARFSDTVRVARAGGLPWDGDESIILQGSPFAESLVVARWYPDSLAFQAAGVFGDYAVSVTNLGSGATTQAAPLRIVPPGYETHVPVSAPSIPAGALPQTRYLLLPARQGDTTDFFQFTPSASLTVTANIASAGSTPATLRWWRCPPLTLVTPPGPTADVIGYVVDERGKPVAGAQITVVGLAMGSVTSSTGRFLLTAVPGFPPVTLQAARLGFAASRTSVQLGVDSVQLPLPRSGLNPQAALSRQGSTVTIPAGACRMLQVLVPSGGGPRVYRLRLTTP